MTFVQAIVPPWIGVIHCMWVLWKVQPARLLGFHCGYQAMILNIEQTGCWAMIAGIINIIDLPWEVAWKRLQWVPHVKWCNTKSQAYTSHNDAMTTESVFSSQHRIHLHPFLHCNCAWASYESLSSDSVPSIGKQVCSSLSQITTTTVQNFWPHMHVEARSAKTDVRCTIACLKRLPVLCRDTACSSQLLENPEDGRLLWVAVRDD